MASLRAYLRLPLGGSGVTPPYDPAPITSGLVIHAGKTAIQKQDVEKNFRTFALSLGGAYYNNGTAYTQSKGALTAANFRPHAGITNPLKSKAYSLAPLRVNWARLTCLASSTATIYSSLVLQDGIVPYSLEFEHAGVTLSATPSTLNASIDITLAGTSILAGGAQTFAALAASTRAGPYLTVASTTVKSGDVLKFTLVIDNTGSLLPLTVYNPGMTLWALTKHVE